MKFNKNILLVIFIFCLALSIRLFGVNWDQGQHLHPDERYLTMVANDISLPTSISQYFNSSTSPLNPYNYSQYRSFVYGTFPLFLTKFLAVKLNLNDYNHLHLLGRGLSALFDSFNIILLYLLALKFFEKKSKLIFLPSIFYALTVLPIQLAHFFTVDTFLNTFLLTTFTLLVYNHFLFASLIFGFAFTSKISAIYFLPVIILFLVKKYLKEKDFFSIVRLSVVCGLFSFIIIRIFQPYIFSNLFNIDSHFISDLKMFQAYASRDGNYPPSVQWLSKIPFLYPIQNIILFGLGLPISILFVYSSINSFKKPSLNFHFIAYFWIIFLFIVQGSQFSYTLRYFLPIYPFFILLSISKSSQNIIKYIFIFQIFLCFCFINIYSLPHSRNLASEWIYKNIPPGSTITNEYWDDPLPMYLNGNNPSIYRSIMISPYDPDTPEKIGKMNSQLNNANYIVMSSNRLWGSIPLVPSKYPLTSTYYNDLFAEKLNFSKLIEINVYPGFRLPFLNKCYYIGPTNFPGIQNKWFSVDSQCNYPGVYFRDNTAEEAFTVYDHPQVLIFQKKN